MIEQREIHAPVPRLHPVEPVAEQPIDVRRYANALRRSRLLIAAITVGLTMVVLLISLALPKTYTAHATILFDESPSVTGATDAERQLATIEQLLTTREVRYCSVER